MIDELLSRLSKSRDISRAQFNSWKNSDVTKQFIQDISLLVLEDLVDEIPPYPDEAMALTQRREGARELLNEIVGWEPADLEDEE